MAQASPSPKPSGWPWAACTASGPSPACTPTIPSGSSLARSGPPLVIGLGEGENFLASDVVPLLRHTRRVIFLEDGDLVELTRGGARSSAWTGQPCSGPR